jgi:hypothetical protein
MWHTPCYYYYIHQLSFYFYFYVYFEESLPALEEH